VGKATAPSHVLRQGFGESCHSNRPKAAQLLEAARVDRFAEFPGRIDPQVPTEAANGGGPKSTYPGQLSRARADPISEFVEFSERATREELRDSFERARPDARERRDRPINQTIGQRGSNAGQGAGGTTEVRAAVARLPVQFAEQGELLESARYVLVLQAGHNPS
jgi:hypothetical protein